MRPGKPWLPSYSVPSSSLPVLLSSSHPGPGALQRDQHNLIVEAPAQVRKIAKAGSSWVIGKDQPTSWCLSLLEPATDELLGGVLEITLWYLPIVAVQIATNLAKPPWAKIKVAPRLRSFLEVLGESLFPCLESVSRGLGAPWSMAPSPIYKCSNCLDKPFTHFHLYGSHLPPSCNFKDP